MMACQKMPKEYFCQTLQGGFHWISSTPSARTTQSRSRRHCSNWHCMWLSLRSSDKATPTPFSLGTAISICAAAAERRCTTLMTSSCGRGMEKGPKLPQDAGFVQQHGHWNLKGQTISKVRSLVRCVFPSVQAALKTWCTRCYPQCTTLTIAIVP